MQLWILYSDGREQRVTLDPKKTLRCGANRGLDLVLSDPEVLPVHFGITYRQGAFRIVASKSAGSVRINDRPVRSAVLSEGDSIEVGQVMIEVLGSPGEPLAGSRPNERSPKSGSRSSGNAIADQLEPLGGTEADDLWEERDEWSPNNAEPQQGADVGDSSAFDDLPAVDDSPAIDLANDDLAIDPGAEQQHSSPAATSVRRTVIPRFVRSPWFGGSIVTVALLTAAGLLIASIANRPSVWQRYHQADSAYQEQDYGRASELFNRLLAGRLPEDMADSARVKRDLAELLPRVEQGRSAEELLGQLQVALSDWGAARSLAAAQEGLARILPPLIAELTRAGESAARSRMEDVARDKFRLADQALQLIYRTVPIGLQHEQQVDLLQAHFTRLERSMNRAGTLSDLLSQFDEPDDSQDIDAAYHARNRWLSQYPDGATSGRLLALMRSVARKQAGRVRPYIPPGPPATGTKTKTPASSCLLAQLSSDSDAAAPESTRPKHAAVVSFPQLAVVYALDQATGRVLWRAPIGGSTRSAPLFDAAGTGSTVVMEDARSGTLVADDVLTGNRLWQLPMDALSGPFLSVGGQIVASTRHGVVSAVDLSTGKVAFQLQLPQSLDVGPVHDPASSRLYQVAGHSVVYVIDQARRSCLSSVYVGHELGSVSVRPVIVDDKMLIFQNSGPDATKVHVLQIGAQLEPIDELVLPLAVTSSEPVVVGTRVYVAGSNRRVGIIQAVADGADHPFRFVGAVSMSTAWPSHEQPAVLARASGRLWVGGDGISEYRPGTGASLPTVARRLAGGLHVEQIDELQGGRRLIAGRLPGRSGYVALCYDATRNEELWRTRLAARPSTELVWQPERKELYWLVENGVLNRLRWPLEAIANDERRVADRLDVVPANVVAGGRSATLMAWGQGVLVGGLAEERGLWQLDPSADGKRFSRRPVLTDCGVLASRPVKLGSDLFVLQRSVLLSLVNSEPAVQPNSEWMPPVLPGNTSNLSSPAVVAPNRLLASDGLGGLFLLDWHQTKATWTVVGHRKDLNLSARPVVSFAKGAVAVDREHAVLFLGLPEMNGTRCTQLDGPVVWGPKRIGHAVVLADQSGTIHFATEGNPTEWQQLLLDGDIVGGCGLGPDGMLIATAEGAVAAVHLSSGRVTRSMHVGQRLAVGPTLVGGAVTQPKDGGGESNLRHPVVITVDGAALILCATADQLLTPDAKMGEPN